MDTEQELNGIASRLDRIEATLEKWDREDAAEVKHRNRILDAIFCTVAITPYAFLLLWFLLFH